MYNPANTTVDISDCVITQKVAGSGRFKGVDLASLNSSAYLSSSPSPNLVQGVTIGPNGYVVINSSVLGFAISSKGEGIYVCISLLKNFC